MSSPAAQNAHDARRNAPLAQRVWEKHQAALDAAYARMARAVGIGPEVVGKEEE